MGRAEESPEGGVGGIFTRSPPESALSTEFLRLLNGVKGGVEVARSSCLRAASACLRALGSSAHDHILILGF
ncbi:hypothetical protein AOLI_G00227650 [Acnodon oligacanthus]